MIKIYAKLPRYVIILAICLSCVVAAATCGGIFAAVSSSIHKASFQTIIVDAGHGGVDPGAIGINGENEKDINLDISLALGKMLTASGFNVIYTRTEDIALHDSQYKNIKQIKTSDLKNRLKLFNTYQDALIVSIHQNKFPQEKYNGAQMFYGKNNAESKPFAQAIQTAVKTNLQPQNDRVIKCSTADVYIINNAKAPAVLVECGFLSNKTECALLATQSYRYEMAFCIYIGIINYCNQK